MCTSCSIINQLFLIALSTPTKFVLHIFSRFARSSGGNGGLPVGPAVLFFCVETLGFNIDSFTMNAVAPAGLAEAYEGGVDIPGKIEAEKFDHGGQGVGYSDTDEGNNGGVGSAR